MTSRMRVKWTAAIVAKKEIGDDVGPRDRGADGCDDLDGDEREEEANVGGITLNGIGTVRTVNR